MLASARWMLMAVAAVLLMAGTSAQAQDMTAADVSRLQQMVDDVNSDLAKLRARDRMAARAMQAELTDLDEEVTYLKVKLRRERMVSRTDYLDVRDRLENLRARVNGNDNPTGAYSTGGGTSSTPPRTTTSGGNTARNPQPGVVPAGTELDVRLDRALSSNTSRVEDRFEATTVVDLREGGRVLIPAGSRVRGVVTAVRNAGRVERKGELQLSFDQVTVDGRNIPIRATVTQALEAGGYKEDAGRIGTGAAVGAILGGIIGGVRGVLTGILIGGGGVVAATEGQDVNLPADSILRIRLDEELNVNRR